MALQKKRKQIYIDAKLQFKYSVILIILVTIEALVVGWILTYAFNLVSINRTDQNIYRFYALLFTGFICITVVNIFVGTYLSFKLAGPIYAFQQKMKEIRMGMVGTPVELREGDELQNVETDMNEMMHAIRASVKEDRAAIKSVQAKLDLLLAKINGLKAGDKEEAKAVIKEISKELKSITSFFKVD